MAPFFTCQQLAILHSLCIIRATVVYYHESTYILCTQEEYYLTHQCFLTNRALFVLVWNVLDGDEGIESISIWLQNLQVRLFAVT